MRVRIPLALKTFFWLLANLCLVAALAWAFARDQFRSGLNGLLSGAATQRLSATGEVISSELRDLPAAGWEAVLQRHSGAHHLQFALFRGDGSQAAGPSLRLPPEVAAALPDPRTRPPGVMRPGHPARPPQHGPDPRQGPPPSHPENPPPDEYRPLDGPVLEPRRGPRPHPAALDGPGPQGPLPLPPRIAFFLRAGQPARYWVGIRIAIWSGRDPRPHTLLLASDSLTGHGLFLDPLPWAGFAAAALAVSALVWLPIVGGITRAVRRVNDAAGRIAKGGFDARIPETRLDELGELAGSVNAMAQQLGEYVSRQRRLTADVAHELCSPIARMQRALALVEQRAAGDQKPYIQRLDHELQHMARLVEEVLSFSRAEAAPKAEPEPVHLAELAAETVAAEAPDCTVEIAIPQGLTLTVLRSPLERALANVVRNAARYAGACGPIRIETQPGPDRTRDLVVTDRGPGVPAEALSKIFEPFYRPEPARQRSTGGTGLGLAIVRSCIQSCGGTVSASLPAGGGLQIRIRLPDTGCS